MNWNEALNRFVHPGPEERVQRYPGLIKPWVLPDGRVAASNGITAVLLNAGVVEVEENKGKVPEILSLFKGGYGTRHPFPALPPILPVPCKLCGGKGMGHECKDCGGTGAHECDCNQCTCDECESCKGTGFLKVHKGVGDSKCPGCNGTGDTAETSQAPFKFLDVDLDLRYLRHFDVIEGRVEASLKAKDNIMYIHFKDGVGAIVPLVKGTE